jgi:hypothetical protein
VPIAVYSLHRTWRAAQSIRRYAADALQAAASIVDGAPSRARLDHDVATDMVLRPPKSTELDHRGLLASRVK